MKIISFESLGQSRLGVMHPETTNRFVDLSAVDAGLPGDMTLLLSMGPDVLDRVRAALIKALKSPLTVWFDVSSVTLLPVVPKPGKVVCVGLNYADHAKEGGNARPAYPDFFFRGSTSLVAHGHPLIRPKVSDRLDYEAELAVIIGRSVRHATMDNALAAVAGYACFNDGTLRDYQRRTSQWTVGKNFDKTGGFGPWMVTTDDMPPGAMGVEICSRLNGQVMQKSNTRDMLWSVADIIVLLSECLTLEPGDVIATGTPAGVGYPRVPPVFMRPGDTVEVEIAGLGVLVNPVAAE